MKAIFCCFCLAVWLLQPDDIVVVVNAERRGAQSVRASSAASSSRRKRLHNLLLRRRGDNHNNQQKQKKYLLQSKLQQNEPSLLSTAEEDYTIIPLLLRPWVSLYRSVPKKVRLPFTHLDITFTLMSAFCLTCLDYTSAFVVSRVLHWPHKQSRAAGGSITTIVHSTLLTIGLWDCLRTEKYSPSQSIHVHPQWWQDAAMALIQFCTGYMLYDAVIQFVLDKWNNQLNTADWLFLGHHAGTALYMTSTRLIQAGHMSAMSLMFLGELTAPIMNLLRITKTAASLENNDTTTIILLPVIEYVFALLYVAFRTVIGPLCAAHLTYDLLLTKQGRKNVSVPLTCVWLTLVWSVLIGSIPWIKNALDILMSGSSSSRGTSLSSLE